MKVRPQCAFCIAKRGWEEIKRATEDEEVRIRAIAAVMRLIGREFDSGSIAARIGTSRDRLIREITGNSDPYRELKHQDNRRAVELLPLMRRVLAEKAEGYEKFREACRMSTLGNAIEPDIPGHSYSLEDLRSTLMVEEFAIDHTRGAYDLAEAHAMVLLLPDNAGEIAVDKLLVEQLKALGCDVVVAVKESPVINDATMEDAVEVGIGEVADEIVTTGADSVGLFLDEVSEEFRSSLDACDLVIAKGMGHYETIPEQRLRRPVLFLFKAKCEPVGDNVGVKKGDNVALLHE